MFTHLLIDRKVNLNGGSNRVLFSPLSTSPHPSLQRRGMKKPPSPHLWERVGVRGGMVNGMNTYNDNLGAFPGLGHFL